MDAIASPVSTLEARVLPAPWPDLIVRPLGDDGGHVVENPRTGEYFHFGPQEAFLLAQLAERRSADELCRSFEERFGESLATEDLEQFLDLARAQHLLQDAAPCDGGQPVAATLPHRLITDFPTDARSPRVAVRTAPPAAWRWPRLQGLLFVRRKLVDPDRFLTWLEPCLRFLWTPAFLAVSAVGIALSVVTAASYGGAWLSQFAQALRWETLVIAWFTILLTALIHECAHGLTCKHFGGEVREIGFLMIFLMPGLYCNVSDAWLFREKSKRLWVTFAGGYCDLVLWAFAVAVWRLTPLDTLLNYIAWVVMSVTGIRAAFNFIPLLKLDGYYLLSDALEIPNLRERAMQRLQAYVRWLCWGAPRPRPEPRGKLLLAFGIASWTFSIVFLGLTIVGLSQYLKGYIGTPGTIGGLVLGGVLMGGLFRGFSGGEATEMVKRRRLRTLVWLTVAAGSIAVLCLPIADRYGGPFELHPLARAEIRAPIAAFVSELQADQGDRISSGQTLVRLEVSDLTTRLAQKRAEIKEAEAELALLKAGTRPEEIARLEARVAQARSSQELAEAEGRLALEKLGPRDEELEAVEARLARLRANLNYLEDLQRKQEVASPVAGEVITPRLKEAVGRYVAKGDLICEVEDRSAFEVEIRLAEEDTARIEPGRTIGVKLRALPYRTFNASVLRIAPAATAAEHGESQSRVCVYCRLEDPDGLLRSHMTGYARIYCDKQPLGRIVGDRLVRLVRTEFWW